jgi:cytochrome c oxidase subunit 3
MKTFEQKQADSKKPLLWISMVSMTMFFAAFISAIIVHKADGKWLEYKLPIWIYISTIIIIISSFTINWAKQSVKINKVEIANRALTYTFNLGLFFALTQFLTWYFLIQNGIHFTGFGSNASGSYLYVLMVTHLLHLFGGLIAIRFTKKNLKNGLYDSNNYLGLELTTIFWHFLDILWVGLFLFIEFYF